MKKVLLIHGGNSTEHEISNISALSIINNIDKTKYDLESVLITQNNEWISDNKKVDNIINYLKSFDVVFPITHGNQGEDGKLQGLLDLFNINYVGSKCGPSYICMDKSRTKEILSYHNIPQVPYQIYKKNFKLNLDFPVIVKPANGGSSIGIQVANNEKELKKAVDNALLYDQKVIIEKFINAQELECAVLENKKLVISEVGEIISAKNFYDYEAKYKNKESKTIIPADIPDDISKKIKKYTKEIFEILELSSFSRVDFFYDSINNKIYLNEINTIPGFTEISMYPKLIMDKGYTYKELISILIENAKKAS